MTKNYDPEIGGLISISSPSLAISVQLVVNTVPARLAPVNCRTAEFAMKR